MKHWMQHLNRRNILLLLTFVAMFSLMVGCGNEATGPQAPVQEPAAQPQRIVSLVPSNTEILFALGLGDAVVGVSDYDNYPEAVQEKTKVGGREFNVEAILELQPDLVLAQASSALTSQDGLEQIRQAGIQVISIETAASFPEVYESIRQIAQVTGTEEAGEQLISEMQTEVDAILEKVADVKAAPSVWIEVSQDLYTAGKGTFMDEMLTMLHAKNIAGETEGWSQWNEEDVIAANPSVIMVTYADYVPEWDTQLLTRAGWEGVQAIAQKQIHALPSDETSRPGPRLVEGLRAMAQILYPDQFTE